MPINMAANNQTPQPDAANQQVDKDQSYWKREIERANKFFEANFWKKADKLYKLYARQSNQSDGKRKFAMFWANTEVLKPSVYARPPVPQVSRRYRDRDPVGRLAAEILERACSYEFERMEIDSTLRSVRDDLLIAGRGAPWLRYEADIEGDEGGEDDDAGELQETPASQPQTMAQPGSVPPGMPQQAQPQVVDHRVVCDYLHYRQFLHEPARRWEEVGWVAKIAYLTDAEGQKRFPKTWKKVGVQLDNKAASSSDQREQDDPKLQNAQEAKATVYEIWSKRDRKVYFIAKSANAPLGIEDPFLDFEGFYPCPKPVFSTLTNNSMIPTADYVYYQDQAEEIDQLTDRIDKLMDQLKMVGFYPSGADGDVSAAIEKALSPETQNQMIGVSSWAAFGERGGSNAIVWLPIEQVANTVKACIDLRNQLIQDTYQITGISDILRGATNAQETATAQSIKAQWGSIRIQDRQQEMVRLARDITRMTAEIISENFDPEYLLQMANMQRPQPPAQPGSSMNASPPQPTGDPQQDAAAQQQFQQQMQQMKQQQDAAVQQWQEENAKYDQAFQLLRDDRLRGFRIEVETDSTIQPDEDAEKQRRTEFVTAIGGLLQQAVPLVMQVPELAGLVGETLLFTARGFRAGRQLEDQIEQSMAAIQERINSQMQQQAQQGPQADPAMEAKKQQAQLDLQHKQELAQQELQQRDAKHQQDMQHAADKHNMEMGQRQTELQNAQQANELQLSHGKAKLRDQILQEDQQAFLGQPGEQVNGVSQVLQETLGQLMQAVTASNQQVLMSNQQLMKALTAPKVITAPDGRTYTAETVN